MYCPESAVGSGKGKEKFPFLKDAEPELDANDTTTPNVRLFSGFHRDQSIKVKRGPSELKIDEHPDRMGQDFAD